jgi:Fe-S cluster assembly iron-binding protein IscA
MLTISEQAIQQLLELKGRQGTGSSIVRIGILSGSSTGPNLGVMIDAADENDEIFTFGTLEVVIDKALLAFCRSISVEYVLSEGGGCGRGGGFKITPQNPV